MENLQDFTHSTARFPSVLPSPRVWKVRQIAARFNRSVAWVYAHMPRLVQLGFPRKDQVLGGWDSLAIEGWFDRRSSVGALSSIEDQMLEAVRGEC